MELKDAMPLRHSVRSFLDRPIGEEERKRLDAFIKECNRKGDLSIQLVLNEPKAFDCLMAHYGKFSGVRNYLALIGKQAPDLDERLGYYGEQLVLLAQTLGLNTCWVAMTYKKIRSAYTVREGERLRAVIALGYGATQGKAHKQKPAERVSAGENAPAWFRAGVEAALLAPTAMNGQKFRFYYEDGAVRAESGRGACTKIDLGIAKCHFELGAGAENFRWK